MRSVQTVRVHSYGPARTTVPAAGAIKPATVKGSSPAPIPPDVASPEPTTTRAATPWLPALSLTTTTLALSTSSLAGPASWGSP